MALTKKKMFVEDNVLTLTLQRIAATFDRFDHVAVLFSGGKDSTVCLNLTLDEARKRGRTPLDVVFYDEEAIHPTTIEYVERVRNLPDVALRWYCVPVQHRNACSRLQPYWYPWAPEDRERWCRPLPDCALTEFEVPGFNRQPIPECKRFVFPTRLGSVGAICGIRADESLRRMRSVSRRCYDNYVAHMAPLAPNVYMVKPIYDWVTEDIWTAPAKFGWDYNTTYDIFTMMGTSRKDQRVCPPYGEEPLRGLWQYAQGWPELWEKMIHRVEGAATAARYSRSPVYGFSGLPPKPEDVTWQEHIRILLLKWNEKERAAITHRIKTMIKLHQEQTGGAEIPAMEPHYMSGLSWKFLAIIAFRGDLKGRRDVGMERGKLDAKFRSKRGVQANRARSGA